MHPARMRSTSRLAAVRAILSTVGFQKGYFDEKWAPGEA